MLKLRVAVSLILITGTTSAFAAGDLLLGDAAHGKKLYDAKCQACHVRIAGGDGSALFTRKDRTVHSIEGLTKRVNGCNQRTNANLSSGDIRDVVKYLNNAYYKFED